MAEEIYINPQVQTALADMSSARIDERTAMDYPRHFWSSVKNGHYRYAMAGIAVGAPISAIIGTAVCAVVGFTFAPLIIPAFIGIGALMGAESFGAAGTAAASRASGLAEKHARILDADSQGKGRLGAVDDRLMDSGRGHHFEFPPHRDRGKFFSFASGIPGALIGAAGGALLGMGGIMAEIPVFAGLLAAVGPVVAGAVVFGLLGLTFGIERSVLKSLFNHSEANSQGKLRHMDGPDIGRMQSQESDPALAAHRLRRQEEIGALEKSYNDRIYWGALGGRFRGFTGVVQGALFGALAGVVALGVVALVASTAVAAAAALVIPMFAAAGGMYAMKLYSESGGEAGAEATAQAIDNEFERNRALRAHGITPPPPPQTKESWFSSKTFLIAGLVGAAVGVALTPVIGPGIAVIMGVKALATTTAIAASAIVGGSVGASYGIGAKGLKAMAHPGIALYDKVVHGYSHEHTSPAHAIEQQIPQHSETITAEDMQILNDRLATGSGKSFAQNIQQSQLSQPLTVGG